METLKTILPITERVQQGSKVIEEGRFSLKETWGEGLSVLNEETVKLPLIKRKALAEAKVLSEMPVQIRDYELVIGSALQGEGSKQSPFMDYATPEEKAAAIDRFTTVHSVFGHTTPHYADYLRKGLPGLRQEVEDKLAAVRREAGDSEQVAWHESVLISLDGLKALMQRYADLAREMAKKETRKIRKQELEAAAEVSENLLKRPPQSFREAVQALWFVHISCYSTLNLLTLGRFDQNLWPFLKKDLENGSITLEEAQELIDLLWLKCNETLQAFQLHFEKQTVLLFDEKRAVSDKEAIATWSGFILACLGGNNSVEKGGVDGETVEQILLTVTVGGLTPEGEDGTNPLTYICLNALRRLKTAKPCMYVRLHDGSPPELVELVADCIRAGCSGPTIYNDEVIIPALTKIGVPRKDALDYTSNGCYEVHLQGRTEFRHVYVSAAESLDRVLNPVRWEESKSDGWYLEEMDIWRDWPARDPYSYETFEEVIQAFNNTMDRNVEGFIQSHESFLDGRLYKIAPLPLLSAFLKGPLEKGKDITLGGAEYIIYMVEVAGLATAADSLAAIKKLCFDEKTIPFAEVLDAIRHNWEGKEYLRQIIKTRVPAYGNDIDYVDDIARRIVESFVISLRKHSAKSRSGTIYTAGVATFENYTALGHLIGATPDGRFAGEPLSDNASPALGRATSGQTAAVNSFLKLPQVELPGGSCLNLAMGSTGGIIPQLEGFIKAFIERRGNIINISVNDVEKLRAAQKEPEKYRDLIVRVGGYDAYFVDLPPRHQELQIQKYEQYC